MIRGVIFDLDGTLLDTETLYRRFWVEAARTLGYPMEDKHALMIRSMAAVRAEALLKREVCPEFDYHAVRALRRERMVAYIDKNGVIPKPGMPDVLRVLKNAGLKIGLATATPEARARKYLRMVDAEAYFDAVTCADMVACGKPAPDIYLLAAKRLGIAPGEAAAVEDAPTGIESAHRAGMLTILIPDQDQPDEKTRALCCAVLPSLRELPAFLQTKLTEKREIFRRNC